jgi:RND family efflux transporter MFP subunit
MKSKKTWITILIISFAILYFGWPNKGSRSIGSVDYYEVVKGNVENMINLTGKVKPISTKSIASTFNARIQEVAVEEGSFVEKGQILIRFSEDDLRSKLENERSKYLKAKFRYEEVKNWQSSSGYISAKTQLEISTSQYQQMVNTYNENIELYEAKAISKQDLEMSKLEMEREFASLASNQAAFQDTVRKGDEDALQEALAELISAEISFKEAKEAMVKKDLKAPHSGVVTIRQQRFAGGDTTDKTLGPNTEVSPGEVLFSIANHDQLIAELQANEADIYRIQRGQQCEITLPAMPEESFSGKVVDIEPKPDGDNDANFLVRCLIENPNSLVKVGLSASVKILLDLKENVIIVPLSSLSKTAGILGVYVVQGKEIDFRPVKIGITNENMAEISEGLSENEIILAQISSNLYDED